MLNESRVAAQRQLAAIHKFESENGVQAEPVPTVEEAHQAGDESSQPVLEAAIVAAAVAERELNRVGQEKLDMLDKKVQGCDPNTVVDEKILAEVLKLGEYIAARKAAAEDLEAKVNRLRAMRPSGDVHWRTSDTSSKQPVVVRRVTVRAPRGRRVGTRSVNRGDPDPEPSAPRGAHEHVVHLAGAAS